MSTLINIFCSYILKLWVHNHYIVKYTLPMSAHISIKHAKLKIMFSRLQMMCYTDIHNTLYVHQMVLYNLTCKMRCHWNKETCPYVEMAACHTNSFTWRWCRSYSLIHNYCPSFVSVCTHHCLHIYLAFCNSINCKKE